MRLRELQRILAAVACKHPNMIVHHGFGPPHSYRGYYEDVAFPRQKNVRIGDMLRHVEDAIGETFTGYKGGEFTMGGHTTCWLAEYGCTGEQFGRTMLCFMLDMDPSWWEKSDLLDGE